MPTAGEKGKLAENLAAEYLLQHGFAILNRNVRLAGGELDIVAQEGEHLVFVEVKAGLRRSQEQCLEAIDALKTARICQAANAFIAQRQINLSCRFDVITVDLSNQPPSCCLWRDAFRPEEI